MELRVEAPVGQTIGYVKQQYVRLPSAIFVKPDDLYHALLQSPYRWFKLYMKQILCCFYDILLASININVVVSKVAYRVGL